MSDGFYVFRCKSKLVFHGFSKTVNYEQLTNLLMLFAESGVDNLKTCLENDNDSLIQDGRLQDNLTNAQR